MVVAVLHNSFGFILLLNLKDLRKFVMRRLELAKPDMMPSNVVLLGIVTGFEHFFVLLLQE